MKRLRKIIATTIVVLMLIQLLPMSVFAVSTPKKHSARTQLKNNSVVADIAREVKEERTEYSKTYLLEDGSYCNISTYTPIHKKVNSEWKSINDSAYENVKSIEKVKSLIQEDTIKLQQNQASSFSTIHNENSNVSTISSLVMNTSACSVSNGEISLLKKDSALIAKPSEIYHYHDQNKLVVRAMIDMECTVKKSISISTIDLKEKTGSWDENTDFSSADFTNEHILDSVSCPSSGSYSWDLTDLYVKWDKNAVTNNGFVLVVSSKKSNVTIKSMCITVIYRAIDETDIESTYHTVDMSRAGTFYVNDLTGTVKLEQDIFGIPRASMPIYLKRIYSLSDTFSSNSSDGLRWNYESKIQLDDEIAAWNTFDGTVKRFIQADPVVNDGEYTKWDEVSINTKGNESNTSLWIKSSELNKTEYDYSNFYIISNNIKYIYNNVGYLIKMQIRNNVDNCINFEYSNNKLICVSYTTEDISTFINISYLTNQIRLHISISNEISGEQIYLDSLRINRTYNSDTCVTTERVIYSDNKYVEYEYNSSHELVKITDENGSTLDLTYYNTAFKGNRLFTYSKTDTENNYFEDITILDDDTYSRIFESSVNGTEEIEYNKDFRIICHWDYNGNYTFVTYDEKGNVTSYVIPEEIPNNGKNYGFNNGNEFEEQKGVNTEYKSYSDFPTGHSILSLKDKGEGCLYLKANGLDQAYGCMEVENLEPDTTYVLGAWIFVESSMPSGEVYIMAETIGADDEQYFSFNYDVTKKGCWQYRLMPFKIKENGDVLISINFDHQDGVFYVDNMVLYKASEAQTDAFDNIKVTPFEIQNNEDGSVNKEVISDGITSMFNEYSYKNNQVSSVTDMRGITTYYGYDSNSGTLDELGTLVDETGSIVNPTKLITGLNRLPTYIEQNVKNVLTDESVKMVSNYTYDLDERICSITNNGVTYNYEYTAGKLTSVSKNNTEMIEYSYDNDKIGSIQYNNGLVINYSYENGAIKTIEFIKSGTSVKKYVYTYGNDGEIQNVVETVGNIKMVYTTTGFEIYSLGYSTSYPIYTFSKNESGTVTEKYYPDVYSTKSDDLKDKVCITKTTDNDTKYVDDITGETTISSNQTLEKVLYSSSKNDYQNVTYSVNRYSVNDYFGRIFEKSTTVKNSSDNSGIRISENYSYKDLSATTTSTLVSSHTSKIDTISSDNIETNKVNDKRFYEYDKAGNLVFEYHRDAGMISPIAYYEYDAANQLVGEYNIDNHLSITYTYDSGGNIKSKNYHDLSSVSCDLDAHKVIDYGTIIKTISYTYNVNSKDLLTNFNGTEITYDTYGNPLNYSGERYTTFTPYSINSSSNYHNKYLVEGTCEWTGKYLSAFESDTNRYLYKYDENGNRISKTIINKNNVNEGENNKIVYELVQEIQYFWNGEILSGYITKTYNTDSNGNTSITSTEVEILYDQKGEAIGFIFDDEVIWYFVKDYNGSVIKIVDASGDEVASISYDAWGQASFCVNADINNTNGRIKYYFFCFAITINPICYKGYLFDYETGLYFSKDKVYSPAWGRYLNHADFDKKLEISYSVTSTNMYAFCNNNPVNAFDPYSYVSSVRAKLFTNSEIASGVDVEMNRAFLSRVFCGLFANSLVKKMGTWEYNSGYTLHGMNAEYIAKSLFAHNVAKYELTSLNAVNASWGDGWSYQNLYNNSVKVYKNDINRNKYEMIWNAANSILQTT